MKANQKVNMHILLRFPLSFVIVLGRDGLGPYKNNLTPPPFIEVHVSGHVRGNNIVYASLLSPSKRKY
jgi:hypothetical protein